MDQHYGQKLLERLSKEDKGWYHCAFGKESAEQFFEDLITAQTEKEVSRLIPLLSLRDTRIKDLDPETSKIMTCSEKL